MSSTSVIVRIELDEKSFSKDLSNAGKQIEKSLQSTSKISKDSSFKSIQVELDSFTKTIKSIDSSLKTLNANISKAFSSTSKEVQVLTSSTKDASGGLKNLGGQAEQTDSTLGKIVASLAAVSSVKVFEGAVKQIPLVKAGFRDINSLTIAGSQAFKSGSNNVVRLSDSFATVSASLAAVSFSLSKIDNPLAKAISRISAFASILAGSFSAAIVLGSLAIAKLAISLGGRLTAGFRSVSQEALEFQKSSDILSATIDSVNRSADSSIGTFDEWSQTIENLSRQFNFAVPELQKTAQEIALVGQKTGLSRKQLEELLKVSVEYAKINRKDVFQTSVNLLNALNGNATAVQALGIKLNQASVQQFAYTKGITKNISSLSDAEKAQIRYSSLLSQYSKIAGIGVIAADSLADQQNRLEISLQRVNRELGKGASIIENNNIINLAFNKILENLNNTFLNLTGFLGAVGARILSVGGQLLKFGLIIGGAVKVLKIFNALLRTETASIIFSKNISLLGGSFQSLARSVLGANFVIKDLSSLLKAFSVILLPLPKSTTSLAKSFTALGLAKQVLVGISEKLVTAFTFLRPILLGVSVVFVKLAVVVGAIIGVFTFLKNIFLELEKRTQAFSTLYSILSETLSASSAIITPVVDAFANFGTILLNIANKVFGAFVFGLSKVIEGLTSLAISNPFNIFSKDSIASLTALNTKLKGFSSSLVAASFDLRTFGEEASRGLASGGEGLAVNLEEISKGLDAIRTRLQNFGLSRIEIIRNQEEQELEIIRLAYENKLIAEDEFQLRRQQIIADSSQRIAEIEAQERQKSLAGLQQFQSQVGQIFKGGITNVISGGIQNIISSLQSGRNVFAAFGSFLLSTFGDLAIQLGQFFILQGIAVDKLLKINPPAAIIAAGVGLVALGSILKGFGGSGGGGGAQTQGVSPAGTFGSGQLSTGVVSDPQQERRETEQSVFNLTVQGDIFDSDETPRRIASLLSGAGARQNIVLRDQRFA